MTLRSVAAQVGAVDGANATAIAALRARGVGVARGGTAILAENDRNDSKISL
jgi:hypothetical protein